MNREELAHILRAASQVVDDADILVIGSQSILGKYSDSSLPTEVTQSVEADIAFFDDPHETKMDAVEGALGEGSQFHESFGVYAQGVTVETAELPTGWRSRLIHVDWHAAENGTASFLDPHDLVIAKLVAGREKDSEFAVALLRCDLINVRTLLARLDLLDTIAAKRDSVRASIEACARSAGLG